MYGIVEESVAVRKKRAKIFPAVLIGILNEDETKVSIFRMPLLCTQLKLLVPSD